MEGMGDPQGPHLEDVLLEDDRERPQEDQVTSSEITTSLTLGKFDEASRHYSKPDWVGIQDGASQVESQNSRAKLATRRANKNSTNEVQQNPPTDGYIFMPTPGLRVTSDAQSNNMGPSK
ncbi:unnamed protein product [Fraxinus pennsylvanica]|uniref:Uncharacterized protein n=1 Tax=Fraxinus pennsylvanica TaxID=56036 RepID=A0AAD2EA85_9LAMI|nr:unnamed protein product [Fraxinus pennsylvanica]